MKIYTEWENLTECQKRHATEMFVELEAGQEECDIETVAERLVGYKVAEKDISTNEDLRDYTAARRFEIDTEDEGYIFVDL